MSNACANSAMNYGFAPTAITIFMTAITMMQKQTQGMRLVLMILPSLPLVPVVAQAETTLLTQIILPIASGRADQKASAIFQASGSRPREITASRTVVNAMFAGVPTAPKQTGTEL